MKFTFKRPSLATIEKGFGLGASIAISILIIVKCSVAIKSGVQTLMGTQPKKKVLVVVSEDHEESQEDESLKEEKEPILEDSNTTSDATVEEEKPVYESSKAPKKTNKK